MGRLQQLRSKALSLRGALALGGAVVVAASMTQVVGTLAAPDEVRTAKLGTSTQNYFPTPLPTSEMTCKNPDIFEADFTWSAPTLAGNYAYRVSVVQGTSVKEGPVTRTQTNYRVSWDYKGSGDYQLVVRVINLDSGAAAITSSGELRHSFRHNGLNSNSCRGSGSRTGNDEWEDQAAGGTTIAPFAAGPATPMFTTLMDTLNSEEMLEPLPEETELADLEAVARPGPTPTDEAQPTETPASTTATSPASPSDEAAPDTETEDGSKVTASSSTRTSPPGPATSTPGTSTPAATATSSRAVPTTPKATVSTTRTATVDPPATPTPPASTTTTTTARAGVGDSQISVGEVFARLDEADGQPKLVITSGAGAEVCTADVPGATRITSAAGKLTVTVDGRTHTVDTGTCAID